MKKTIFAFIALSLMTVSVWATEGEKRMKVNTDNSRVEWTGSKITGSSHTGSIAIKAGSLTMNGAMISAANVTIDMTSIVCNDDMDQEYKDKLVGHLMSPDFFNTKEHSEAHFVLKSFEKGREENYEVTGTLTIKGISHEISFPAMVSNSGDKTLIDAEMTFDRSLYDVRYGSGSFFDNLGDNMINDDVQISLHIEAQAK